MSGGKCPGGKCPRGICPWGKCLGVHVRGGYVLVLPARRLRLHSRSSITLSKQRRGASLMGVV